MERAIPSFRLRYLVGMDPARKRRVRLVVALSAAVVLAAALVYTSFSASSEARSPSQLLAAADAGRSYQLTGKVVPGTIEHKGTTYTFRVRDRAGTASVPVSYTGSVSDTFKAGREVVVTVRKQGDVFVGEKDSLLTKCPSKFQDKQSKTTST
jgi:cytochrome c-type biogenesis protein CcmE